MAFNSRQLPSGTWRGGFRHPVTRKVIWSTKDEHGHRFAYRWEADAWAVTAEERAKRTAAGEPTDPAPATTAPAARYVGPRVGEYGEAFLGRHRVERATRDKYRAFLSGLTVQVHPEHPAPATVPMGLLGRDEVRRWVVDSEEAGIGRPSINGRLRLLRMLYADLLDSDEAPTIKDPTRGIKYLTEEHDDDHEVTDEEEAALLAEAGPQLRAAILTALDAGLRWQEVYGLRVDSVSRSYLVVSHVIERGRVELRAFTKGKKPRNVPMTLRLEQELAPLVKAARKRGGNGALLFPAMGEVDRVRKDRREALIAGRIPWQYANHRQREWLPVMFNIGAAQERFTETGRTGRDGSPILQRRIVEPEFGFHALRHTYGSRLAAMGVPRREIAELMGHADERTTGRYIHAGDDGRRLALVREALGGRAA